MALKFNKIAVHDKETKELKYYYAKAHISGKMNSEQVAERMAKTTQWSKGAIIGFLHDLATFLHDECGDGTQITLNGIGVFEPTVSGKSAKEAGDIKKSDLTAGIILKANSDLLKSFANDTQLEYTGNVQSEEEGDSTSANDGQQQGSGSTSDDRDGD